MKKIYIGIIALSGLLFTSTGCSDFLNEPSREKIGEEDKTDVSAEQMLTGVYGQFCDWDYAFSYLGITEIISDNADKGSSSADTGGDKINLDNFTYNSSSGSFLAMWTRWYKSIGKATQSIEFTEKANLENSQLEHRYIAEARFLRALNYFFLVRGWGDVPLQSVDETKRAPVSDVYAYIIEDLKYSIDNLPLVSEYAARDLGRASKGAAQGLLSKVYLYQKDYQNSYDYANAVINSGQYALLTNFADVFKTQNINSSESIFEFQAKAGDGNSIAQGIQQITVTQGARSGSNPWGWGFNTPSENLLKAFEAAGDNVRRDATIIFRNQTLWDGRSIGNTENARYNYKAYTTNSPKENFNDRTILYLRYAEIFLIKAEAANELGKTAEALQALNTVRSRVNLPAITETNKDNLRQIIWNERRLELAMEYDRWFDLNRTGQAEAAMKADGKPFTDKNKLYPIPYKQLLQLPEMAQNPGW